jgi:hypothetical protein
MISDAIIFGATTSRWTRTRNNGSIVAKSARTDSQELGMPKAGASGEPRSQRERRRWGRIQKLRDIPQRFSSRPICWLSQETGSVPINRAVILGIWHVNHVNPSRVDDSATIARNAKLPRISQRLVQSLSPPGRGGLVDNLLTRANLSFQSDPEAQETGKRSAGVRAESLLDHGMT